MTDTIVGWKRHLAKDAPLYTDFEYRSVQSYLDEAAEKYGSRKAVIFQNLTYTYKQLKDKAEAFAASLRERGLQTGDRVAIMMPNIPQTIVAFWGAMKAGAVVVMDNVIFQTLAVRYSWFIDMTASGTFTLSDDCRDYVADSIIPQIDADNASLSEKQKTMLLDTEYPFYAYDVLGMLKGTFVPKIFIDATDECPKLPDMVKLCKEVDAYLCYAYLGDVGDSVTGDKKAQKFEDDYLDDVFECLKEEGVKAVTYMPTRNTQAQLERLRGLCDSYGMFQISGEDINSPRQSFIIRAMENPMFQNLIDATWKLIEHEKK